MLKHCLSCLPLVVLLTTPLTAAAQDKAAQPKREQPSLVIRLRSLDALFETSRLEALKPLLQPLLMGKADLEELIKEKTGPNGLEGVDYKRSIAVYLKIDADVEKMKKAGVIMVPIADEKKFVATLEKLGFGAEKDNTGLYTIKQMQVPMDLFFRFANKYAYIAVGNAENIDKNRLALPKEIFPKELTGLLSVSLRIEHIPNDL